MKIHRVRLIIFLFCLCSVSVNGQLLKGQIATEDGNPISNAWVYWPGINERVSTNSKGEFEIARPDTVEIYLVAGAKGFESDTFLVEKKIFAYIELTRIGKELEEVQVIKKLNSSFISEINTEKTEVITQRELTKAACCDMAGCFETQGTVQPQTTNVITNAKELRILGLSGVYNQILIDGLPMIQGLTYTYGVSSFPSSIIGKIFVAKGANSVLQGFESISGQINVVTRDPEKEPLVYLNSYLNNFGEWHLNSNYSSLIGKEKKWATLVGLHLVKPANRRDRDSDGFLDVPFLTRYSVFNRWNFGKENEKGFYALFSFRLTKEQRIGGQRSFDPSTDKGSGQIYGQVVDMIQPELIGKFGYRFSANHSVSTLISTYSQEQNSFYGTLKYSGIQRNINATLQHQWNWNSENSLTWGSSFRFQKLKETIAFTENIPFRTYAGNYSTDLAVPGIFAEHSSRFLEDKLSWIVGARMDWHQKFGGYFTPRTMIKWDFVPGHILRASAGTGWRQVNLFSENINLLASSRNVIFEEPLNPEKALNWGLNYTHTLDWDRISGTVSADFYQTQFQNQFFPDFDREPGKAFIRNFTGTSVSNGFQFDANLKFVEIWEMKVAYNFVEVYRKINGTKINLPFNPANRIMASLSYRPEGSPIFIDFNAHWFDRQRLPATRLEPDGAFGPSFSKAYALLNGQITWNFRLWEVYGGVENIFDFRQKQPIVGWQNPFGPNFDTSTVWGPTRGRELYLGFRWRLDRGSKT